MSDKIWWEKNRGKVQWMLNILSAIVSPLITWKITDNVYLTMISVIFGPLLLHSIVNMTEFNVLYPKMRHNIDSVLGGLRNIASFLDEANHLDRGKRGISIAFAISSLNSLTQKGFIEVDVPFYDFLDYVKDLSRVTTKKIYGTSTIRRPKDFAEDQFLKNYLTILVENPQREFARITILNEIEIKNIIKEALENLKESSESLLKTLNDLPEIEWWVSWANQVSYNKCMEPGVSLGGSRTILWTTHHMAVKRNKANSLVQSTIRPGTIEDYAVFDDSVVLKFRENRNDEMGILFLSWGNNRVNQYTVSMERINNALKAGPSLTLRDLGLFPSFFELLRNIEPIQTMDVSEFSSINSYFQNHHNVPIHSIYEKILELVNDGKLEFNPKYLQVFSLES